MLAKPDEIGNVYALLRTLAPFRRWKLPLPHEVRFAHLEGENFAEFFVDEKDRCWITLNPHKHVALSDVASTVAHEMIHMRQHLLGRLPDREPHNAEFRRLAHLVCRELGIQIGNF